MHSPLTPSDTGLSRYFPSHIQSLWGNYIRMLQPNPEPSLGHTREHGHQSMHSWSTHLQYEHLSGWDRGQPRL